jgi:hypothetical protein
MILKTAKIKANRTVHVVSGPAPIAMGKGPMNMMAPKLAEPPSPLSPVAIAKTITPTKTIKKPIVNNSESLRELFDSSVAPFAVFSFVVVVFPHLISK